jgi:hypothetical protein
VIRGRVRLIAVSVSVAAFALGAGTAAGAQTEFHTFFTKFKYERESSGKREFKGTIDSPKSKCVNGRKVKLIRQHNGNKTKLGSDDANSDGHFDIKLSSGKVKDGKYYAKVKKKGFDSGTKTCLSAISGSIKISSG